MYRFHFQVFIKTLIKNRLLTFINIFGLLAGFLVAFMVWAFVSHERSYDRFFENRDRVYRVIRNWQDSEKFSTDVPAPLAASLRSGIPDIIATTRLYESHNNIIIKDAEVFQANLVVVVDSLFFRVFGYDLLSGDRETCLAEPNTAVISLSTARLLFNRDDVIGMNFRIESSDLGSNGKMFEITGVYEDFPVKSHFRPGIMLSSSSYRFMQRASHLNHFLTTYVLLDESNRRSEVEEMLPSFMESYYGTDYYNYSRITYLLQPLNDIHLNSKVYVAGYETPKGNYFSVRFFPPLALFILIISVINFVNLHTSQSLGRKKEIWVKYVHGARPRRELVFFILDSIILFLLAYVLALCLFELLLPSIESLVDRKFAREDLFTPSRIGISLLVMLLLASLSGLYPALSLISRKDLSSQDSWKGFTTTGVFYNSTLIVLQFVICMFFLMGSILVYKQFAYLEQVTRRGFDKEHILLLKNPWYLGNSHSAFKQALRSRSGVLDITCSESVPGIDNFSTWGHPVDSALDDSHITVFYCDYNYASTLKLNVIQGRFFSPEYSTDNLGIVLNETAIRKLGWKDPIGKRYRLDTVYRVIGVVQDFNYESLHNEIQPLGMVLIAEGSESFISVRIAEGNTEDMISGIGEIWDEFVPDRPLEYSFMDQEFDFWYRTDRKIGLITGLLSILAIIISSLGILGLMTYLVTRRTKEIGIRKVNGAHTADIHLLFIKDTSKWLFIALIFAIPISIVAMKKWLQGFAYKTQVSWWIFVIVFLAIYAIALATIFWQSVKAARQNPIDSLRYE